MSETIVDMKIMSKRLELLELKIKEFDKLKPEVYDTRLLKVEESIYAAKEMLTLKYTVQE